MIDKYLISNCLFIIDEINERYKNRTKEELRDIADLEINESDLVVTIGYPFRHMANFNMQGKAKDIVVKSKDFVIEVKYLRNFISKTKTKGEFRTNKITWYEAFEKDFTWLTEEIKKGKKGNRAFMLGWVNVAGRKFGDIMQIGIGTGKDRKLNKDRVSLFPFINYNPKSEFVNDVSYRYSVAYKPVNIAIAGIEESVDCIFLGRERDLFHFAIYV